MKNQTILPALRGVIGDWVFYSSLMTAKQISNLVKPVKEIRESKNIDEILQRDLKDRKVKIANYLLNNKSRFFNSIVIGVFDGVPDWYEFSFKSQTFFNFPKESLLKLKQSMGFLVLNGTEKMFAIDGQHRVAGIEIAVKNDKDNKILLDDQFSVIFLAHIDDKMGRKRTRKLFSDINKNAKPVAEGDKLKIDEDDLNAIVTRRLYANYKHFKELISLTENSKLNDNDVLHFTNLLGLYNCNKVLRKLFKVPRNTKESDEDNIENFYKVVSEFYDFIIINISQYKDFFINKTLTLEKVRENNKYLLFRPIGLKLIAKIYVYYFLKNDLGTFKKYIEKVNFVFPNSPYDKVLWNNGKIEAKTKNQNLAYDLTLYLFNEFDKKKEKTLLEKYRFIRKNESVSLPKKLV